MRSKQKQPRSIRSRPYTRSFAKTQINTEINDEKHSDRSPNGSVINISQGFEDSFVTQSIDSTYKGREGPTDISQDSLKDKLVENLNNTASTLEITENNEHDIYCYSSCRHGRNYDRSMLQCSVCMGWFHTECADSVSDAVIWNCLKCRAIPDTLNNLNTQINELHTIFSHFIEKQNEMYETISIMNFRNENLLTKVQRLELENHKLRLHKYNHLPNSTSSDSSSDDCSSDDADYTARDADVDVVNQDSHPSEEVYVNVISDNSDSHKSPTSSKTRIRPKNKQNRRRGKKGTTSSITGHNLIKSCTIINHDVNDVSYSENASIITEDNSVEKPKLTVFGDSIIRNTGGILTKNLPNMDTIVLSHSGLKIYQATQQVEHIFQRHTKKDIIVLQVGSNDVPYEDTKDILNKYNHLISTVRSNAPD